MTEAKKLNPKAIGEITEGVVLAHLLRLGRVVLIPFGNNQRYDLVVDAGGGRFIRGQCKTAVYRNGCVIFRSSSKNGTMRKARLYTGQIDVFWVFCSPLEKLYEVPVESAPHAVAILRVDALKPTAPRSTVRWAKDFEM